MKQFMKSFAVFALCFCLLTGGFAVLAERWTFEDGKLPDGWSQVLDESEVTATNILEPVNPNASQEARNLYAYLCTLANADEFLTGQFDIGNSNRSYETVTRDFGFEPALYSARYVTNIGEGSDYSITRSDEQDELGLYKISYPDDLMLCTPDSVEKVNNLMKRHYDNGNVLLIHSDSANRDVCAKAAMLRGKYDTADDVIMELDMTNPDRDLPVYGPGGYFWQPKAGDQVLVIKGGVSGDEQCVAGAAQVEPPEDMEPGDIYLSSGEASIYLHANGRIDIEGDLYINGTEYKPCTCVPVVPVG